MCILCYVGCCCLQKRIVLHSLSFIPLSCVQHFCLSQSPGTHLHYWFAETTNPKADKQTPVVLWLNGYVPHCKSCMCFWTSREFAESSLVCSISQPFIIISRHVKCSGPGSSSILGMLQEHGPLLINATGGLMDNPYAWTNLAHLVGLTQQVKTDPCQTR